METLRYNFFHRVHQALRALLYHASISVQHTDFTNETETNKVLSLLKEVAAFFEGHAENEDRIVFPMIEPYAPELAADFEQQHEKDHQLGEALINAIYVCQCASNDKEKIIAGQKLQKALTDFSAFNLTHMNQEEALVLPLILEHYTDEQILQKEAEIVAGIPHEKKLFSCYWMLKGLATYEIIEWFGELHANMPPVVFGQFMQLAENALSADKFEMVKEALAVRA